jgi:hypothetical protein
MRLKLNVWFAALAIAVSQPAIARTATDDTGAAERIAARFVKLAGSEENALALVNALRSGDRVILVSGAEGARTPMTTTFELPTHPMGWDDVNLSLALARDSLVRVGIVYPTAEELEAALVGGDVAGVRGTTTLTGVLQMLKDGLEWRQIRQVHAGGKKN